ETNKPVVFLAVGFETTAPTIAATILSARRKKVPDFYLLTAHKLIPPAMEALLSSGRAKIDAFICPGHVSTIIGSKPYEPLAAKYKTPCIVTGFEPLDILQSLLMILRQVLSDRAEVEVQYRRVVRQEGSKKALETMYSVFDVSDAVWRGIGTIPATGLRLKDEFEEYDAEKALSVKISPKGKSDKRCICGLIMQGLKLPLDCKLFAKECTPLKPIGPCMVSSEGSCAAFYKYERRNEQTKPM
ncbi:MAG: hydrogenase formation protein HypD, partial [Planctomycetota bacterium]|nr:hydrogenase formation protein HypD [Planctomycetota bacterium]